MVGSPVGGPQGGLRVGERPETWDSDWRAVCLDTNGACRELERGG